MVNTFALTNLRNAEHYAFIKSVCAIFEKYGVEHDTLTVLLDQLTAYIANADAAMTFEKQNEKVREKNELGDYRYRLHSKLFNYLKSILYDEQDERFDYAQTVMKIVKEMGNPSKMSEKVESVMLTTLGNKLEPFAEQLDAIGAKRLVDDLMNANNKFIEAERQTREVAAQLKANRPMSVSELRKTVDPAYRAIIGIINGYVNVPDNKDTWKNTIDEMNVLVTKYDHLLASRKWRK